MISLSALDKRAMCDQLEKNIHIKKVIDWLIDWYIDHDLFRVPPAWSDV